MVEGRRGAGTEFHRRQKSCGGDWRVTWVGGVQFPGAWVDAVGREPLRDWKCESTRPSPRPIRPTASPANPPLNGPGGAGYSSAAAPPHRLILSRCADAEGWKKKIGPSDTCEFDDCRRVTTGYAAPYRHGDPKEAWQGPLRQILQACQREGLPGQSRVQVSRVPPSPTAAVVFVD